MTSDRTIGAVVLGGSVLGMILYAVFLWYWAIETLVVTAFLGVALLLGILAWIGYTMFTTPPPEPMTDVPEVPETKPEEKKP